MIAVQDDKAIDVWKNGETEANRVPGATRGFLHDRDRMPGMRKPGGQIGGLGTDNQDQVIGTGAGSSADHALDHGNAGNGMQGFGDQRVQTGAGARGKNDQPNPFGSSG